jgi:hypothetical protein
MSKIKDKKKRIWRSRIAITRNCAVPKESRIANFREAVMEDGEKSEPGS